MEVPFSDYGRAVNQLEAVLVKMGIPIKSPSSFQRAREILSEMERGARGEWSHTDKVDHRENWRRGFSLGDLATKLVAVSDCPDFGKLRPHLELLSGDSELSLFSFSPKEQQKNDLVFELRIAACALQMLTNCEFDNPKLKNASKTPDAIGDFQRTRWAIECKTLHPQNPQTAQSPESLLQRIQDARDQIDAVSKSGKAQSGFVVINMKNCIDHDALWPAEQVGGDFFYRPYGTFERAKGSFATVHDRFITAIRKYLAESGVQLSDLFVGKNVAPFVLFVYSSVVGIVKNNEPTFTMLRVLAVEPTPTTGPVELAFMQKFNNCLQDVPEHPLIAPEEIG